jgi:hypothetical protein
MFSRCDEPSGRKFPAYQATRRSRVDTRIGVARPLCIEDVDDGVDMVSGLPLHIEPPEDKLLTAHERASSMGGPSRGWVLSPW